MMVVKRRGVADTANQKTKNPKGKADGRADAGTDDRRQAQPLQNRAR